MKKRLLSLIVMLAAAPLAAQPGNDLPVRSPGAPESVASAALSALTGPMLEELAQFLAQAVCSFANQESVAVVEPDRRRWWGTRAARRLIPCEEEERVRARRWIVRSGRWLTPRPRTCKPRSSK